MFSIGEFSKITGLTVKTLRFYHEQELLVPSFVDEPSGYRYYGPEKIETARIIAELRDLEFSLSEIAAILGQGTEDDDVLAVMQRQKDAIEERIRHYRRVVRAGPVPVR